MPNLHDRAQDELLLVLERVELQLLDNESRITHADPICSAAVYISQHVEDRFGVKLDLGQFQSGLSARKRFSKTVVTGSVEVAGVELDVSCTISRHAIRVLCLADGRRVESAGDLAGLAVEHQASERS